MMRERVPIHVQASKEVSVLDNNISFDNAANDLNFKKPTAFGKTILKNNTQSSGTQIHGENDKTQFRIRPQTPKLDVILLKKTQKKKLTKIDPVIVKPKNVEMPKLRLGKKIKVKKRPSLADEATPVIPRQRIETNIEKEEVVHTQQNFYTEKLEENQEPEEPQAEEIDIDMKPKSEAGVLFGAAYENKYIDIIENEDVENETEINEKMIEISLGMSKDELRDLTKIEIRVDTTNTHMQHVGEVLQSLTTLRLNDSVIPSARDLGTSFRNLQSLSLNRCELKSLAGLSSFEFLKELYASYNYIDDLFDVSY